MPSIFVILLFVLLRSGNKMEKMLQVMLSGIEKSKGLFRECLAGCIYVREVDGKNENNTLSKRVIDEVTGLPGELSRL